MTQWKTIPLMLLFLGIGGAAMWGGIQLSSSQPFSNPPHEQPPVPLSVGVVDINSIKANSKVFQRFKKVLDGLNATIHKEVLERETALRAEYEQFKKREEEATEPTPELLKQKTELDKKYAELEKTVQTRREELEQQYTQGLINIKQTLKEIMEDLGKTHGLTLLLNKSIGDGNQMDQSIVLFCNKGLDLTEEVIQRLDAQLLSENKEKEAIP
ncbi:MAG: hypothetical protein K0R76_694 [Alphaproteobacteria bacterium]|jgi:Skp family chaperone for outer membrane proteins|nr:hypothetical protein [Alphaproteobacteria bacterium]